MEVYQTRVKEWNESICVTAFYVDSRRKMGRPKTTWRGTVEKERNGARWKTCTSVLIKQNMIGTSVVNRAEDRAKWNGMEDLGLSAEYRKRLGEMERDGRSEPKS